MALQQLGLVVRRLGGNLLVSSRLLCLGQRQAMGRSRNVMLVNGIRLKSTEQTGSTFRLTGMPKLEAKSDKPKIKPSEWFVKDSGKYASLIITLTFALGVTIVQTFPHRFGQNFMRDLFKDRPKRGSVTRVSSRMEEIILEVMQKAAITVQEIKNIKIYVSFCDEPYSWGTIENDNTFNIGYPHYLNYESPDDVKVDTLTQLDMYRFFRPISVSLSDAAKEKPRQVKAYLDSLLLSEEGKKFIIAREIEFGRQNPFRLFAMESNLMIAIAYTLCHYNNKLFGLFRLPKKFRICQYAAVWFFCGLTTLLLRDYHRKKTEVACDVKACQIGPEFARGGIEYYSKTLERNKAFRSLCERGDKFYNMKGDPYPGIIRIKKTPISERKDICESILKNHSYS